MQKGPKVQLDRSVVEKYFQEEDSEEERRKEAELQRKRKKAAYYNRMANKNWKTQSQGPVGSPRKAYASGSAPAVLPKKFKCDLCSKSYGYLGALTNHKRKEHNSKGNRTDRLLNLLNSRQSQRPKKFKCDICSKPYDFLGALKNHKRTVHGQGVSRNYRWTDGQWTNEQQEENGFDQEVVLLDTDGKSNVEFITSLFTLYQCVCLHFKMRTRSNLRRKETMEPDTQDSGMMSSSLIFLVGQTSTLKFISRLLTLYSDV